MQLTLSSEQTQLKDGVERFVADRYSDRQRRDNIQSADGFGRTTWREMAELGWLGAGLSEDEGGYGGSPVETMVIMEAAGRGLMQEPLLPVMVHAVRLLLAAGRKADDIAAVVAGEEILTLATEDQGTNGRRATTTLKASGEGYVLSGRKRLVPFGDVADGFLVTCEIDGEPAIVRMPSDADGVEIVGYRTMDNRRSADVAFTDVALPSNALIARGDTAAAAIAAAEAHAIAALCAEATGVAQFLFDQTLDYVKTRQQFGQAIGQFQAIQHRLADMFVALEEARSLTVMATVKLISGTTAERDHALAAAKLGVTSRAVQIGREAIQLHGGVGMTEDLPIGAGFRRLKTLSLVYGDESSQLDRMVPGISAGTYA